MSVPADTLLDDMLETIATAMQCPAHPVAFVVSHTALRAVRAPQRGELTELCGVRVLTMDSQTEPIKVFFRDEDLAEYLRT